MQPARIIPCTPPDRQEQHERTRALTAANHAKTKYPGPAGEILSREILDWHHFGYRGDNNSPTLRLIRELTRLTQPPRAGDTPCPATPTAAQADAPGNAGETPSSATPATHTAPGADAPSTRPCPAHTHSALPPTTATS